jgi:CheY-like chemotaxis protein
MHSANSLNTILIIEDNPVDLDLTARALATRNITNKIQVARDGEEALLYLDRWEKGETPPAFILLDLNMPKINGLEVLEKFKSHPKFKTIPIVILTTSAESSDLRSAYSLGANSYIVKPVDFGQFMEIAGHIELYWRVLNKTA